MKPLAAPVVSESRVAVAVLATQAVAAEPVVDAPGAAVPPPTAQPVIEAVAVEQRLPKPALAPAEVAIQLALNAPRALLPAVALDERLASSLPGLVPPETPEPQAKAPPAVALPVKLAEPASPRLERVSRGEVALVTSGKASWTSQAPARIAVRKASAVQTASADSTRWIPLRLSAARPGVQVLNAARSQGLAASARGVLFGRGWRAVGIGNATAVRTTSVVFYPANRAALGRRLAAQFGVAAKLSEHRNVVLVLGRDSLDKIAGQRRS